MSSPPDSITDIDEIALNKKRGRAQSVEPTSTQQVDDEHLSGQEEASSTLVSAPKKTKRDDEENSATVSTIRRNMKDMSTTDKALSESHSTATSESHEDDEHMLAEDATPETKQTIESNPLAAKFGVGKNDDEDDWGEFAEDDDTEETTKTTKVESEKPKYTFGASSGFGTKGWAATHQTIPTPSKQPTFGGFGSSSGFGGFKSATSGISSAAPISTSTEKKDSVPSFGSFAKATASPFAAAAAAGNALSSNSPTQSSAESSSHADNAEKEKESEEQKETDDAQTFGETAKVKLPGVKKQTEVITGEEDEKPIYQTKAKLLVLDTATNNWKERGVGTFRINMKEEETKKVLQTRLVMRTDSVYRVILNLLLFEGMKVFIMQDKFVRFAGFESETKEDGTVETKLVSFALKLSNPTVAQEVCEQIIACIPSGDSKA